MSHERPILEPEHESFRQTVRSFLEREVVPFHDQWEKDGVVPRDLWTKAGAQGLLCFDVDEEYGGPGVKDFRYNMVMAEELTRAGVNGPGFLVHTDIIVPYLSSLGTEEQKRRWLPGCVSGEIITAIAMTEPGAGSDLQGIKTTARKDGNHYVINGSKTYITNGQNADLMSALDLAVGEIEDVAKDAADRRPGDVHNPQGFRIGHGQNQRSETSTVSPGRITSQIFAP